MFVFVLFSSSTLLAAEKALMDKIAMEEKRIDIYFFVRMTTLHMNCYIC